MKTIEGLTSPLEFAYTAAKRLTFPSDQIHSLRQVAARYAKTGTTEGLGRSVEVLEKARQLYLCQVHGAKHPQAVELPSFAADFELAGRHDLALRIIDDSILFAERLRRKQRVSMNIMIADALHSIGESTRCQDFLKDVRSYYNDLKRRISHMDGPFDVLHSLYLKIDDIEAANILASKMKGIIKVEALTALAFHQKPFGRCGENELYQALGYSKRYGYEDPVAQIAGMMTKQGLDLRGRCILARVKTESIEFEGSLNVLVALLETEKYLDAIKILNSLCSSSITFFCFNAHRVKQLVKLLLPEHSDVAKLLLDRVREEADGVNAYRDRFLRYSQYASLVAPHSRPDAEEMVDHILACPVADLGHQGKGPKVFFNPSGLCIIYELAMVVDEHGLRWDEDRKERFRIYMKSTSTV